MKTNFYVPAQKYIAPSHVFKRGDLLLINFDTLKNSRFEVVSVNKKQNVLKVKVLEDYCKVEPFEVGSIVDLGKMIFDQEWTFKHIPKGAK